MFKSRLGQEIFLISKSLVRLRGSPSFLLNGHWVSFPGMKRRWPPFSTDVKNGWRCISVPPTCLSGVDTNNYTRHCCLISDLLLYYFDITSIYWASGTATNVSITHVLYMLSDSAIPGLLCCIFLWAANIVSINFEPLVFLQYQFLFLVQEVTKFCTVIFIVSRTINKQVIIFRDVTLCGLVDRYATSVRTRIPNYTSSRTKETVIFRLCTY